MTSEEAVEIVANAYDAMMRTRQELEKVAACIVGPFGELPERSEVRMAIEENLKSEKKIMAALKVLYGLTKAAPQEVKPQPQEAKDRASQCPSKITGIAGETFYCTRGKPHSGMHSNSGGGVVWSDKDSNS